MTLGRRLSLWLPVAALMALLFLVSSRSDLKGVPKDWDKVLHLGAYTLLGLLALRAFHGNWKRLAWRPALGALLLTVGYGALDEFHQSSVSGRDASLGDWLADLGGAVLALACLGLIVASRLRAVARRTGGDR